MLSTHNLDVSTNTYESRGVLHAKVALLPSDRTLHLVTTHLNLLEGGRILQTRQLIDWLRKEVPDNEPVILAGDFNDWPQSLTQLFEEFLGLRECFKVKRGKHARTFPAIFPRLALDRIYFRGLKLTSAETFSGPPWISLSDHLPLFAEFEIE
jgi:endonuclease/exonuclease/phosphatase family metal-dependent hydrolase